jgi:hypothetical protein
VVAELRRRLPEHLFVTDPDEPARSGGR